MRASGAWVWYSRTCACSLIWTCATTSVSARATAAACAPADLGRTVELLGLSALLDRAPDSLSGGEARRVAIGRALLAKPAALLLDEPLGGLHRSARDDVLAHLRQLRAELRVPVIMVSHQL